MKKSTLLATLAIFAILSVSAQRPDRQQMTEQERQQWLTELRAHKHEFISRELSLSKEQQAEFLPIYDQMDDELTAIAIETRDMEANLETNAAANDDEYLQGALALFEQKKKESEIELLYFQKFKEVLTPKQLFRLKNTERKFTHQLLRQHQGKRKR